MGVPNGMKYVREHCHKGCRRKKLKKCTNKVVVIDAPKFFWARWSVCHRDVVKKTDITENLPDQQKIFQKCFDMLKDFLIKWMEHDIVPVFIFDGDTRPEKQETTKSRQDGRDEKTSNISKMLAQLRELDPLDDDEELKDAVLQELLNNPKPTYKALMFFKEFLGHLGLPCLQAIHDAEQLSAVLVIEGYAYAAYTDDFDIFAFGAGRVITKIEGYDEVEFVNVEECLREMKITYPQLVDICILTGCDFNRKIKGIGFSTAFKLIKKYGSIEGINVDRKGNIDLAKAKGFRLRQGYKYPLRLTEAEKCRRIFRFLPSIELIKNGELGLKLYSLDELQKICAKHGLEANLAKLIGVRNVLNPPAFNSHQEFYLI